MILQDLSLTRCGVGMTIWPGDPTYGLEIQRDSVTVAILPPAPMTGLFFIDYCAADGVSHAYQVRHVKPGSNPGTFFSIGNGKGIQLDAATIAAAVNQPNSWPQVSTGQNRQSSIVPTSTGGGTSMFSWKSGGPGAGQMWISFGWSAQTAYRPDGTNVAIPAPPAAPSAPTLGQVAGGVLGARTRWARIAYARTIGASNLVGIYPVSAESSFAISANNLLKVTSPPAVAGYDGWVVLVGSASNAEIGQPQANGATQILGFGSDWTEPTTGFKTTNVAYDNANWKSLTLPDLDPSVTVLIYPYYNLLTGIVELGPVVTSTPDAPSAREQLKDGRIPLSALVSGSYSFSTSTSIAGNSNSGTGGGGRFT